MKISEATAFLENAYIVLNNQYFGGQLPPVVITVQSSKNAYGWYTTKEIWFDDVNKGFKEINLGAETLDRPVEFTVSTLLHEMVHHYCAVNGIKDTSRGGTYHNKRFKTECEKRDLIIDYDPRIGFSPTTPSKALMDFIEGQGWQGVNLARQGVLGLSGGKGGGRDRSNGVRKYVCPECGISVRATKAVNIGCLDCGTVMVVEEK